MNDQLFEEMLAEIEDMTVEQYGALYLEAQQLPSFPPVLWEPVSATNPASFFTDASSSNFFEIDKYEVFVQVFDDSCLHSEEERVLCPKAA